MESGMDAGGMYAFESHAAVLVVVSRNMGITIESRPFTSPYSRAADKDIHTHSISRGAAVVRSMAEPNFRQYARGTENNLHVMFSI